MEDRVSQRWLPFFGNSGEVLLLTFSTATTDARQRRTPPSGTEATASSGDGTRLRIICCNLLSSSKRSHV